MEVVSLHAHIPLLTDKPCIAVAIHTDFDYIDCHDEFLKRCVQTSEAEILAAPTRATTLAEQYVTDKIFTSLPAKTCSSDEYSVKSAPITHLLHDGDIIDLGNHHFQVIRTPGHSPGSTMLFEKAAQILFSGDTVDDGPLIDDTYHSNISSYLDTIKKILELRVRIVYGGHFPSFGGQRYKMLIRAYLDKEDK